MSNTWKTTLERLPNVVKYLLVIGVVVVISKLSPDNVRFKYNYELGQVWRYDDLTAPFNFAIKKPESEYNTEVKLLESELSPLYQLDQQMVKLKKQEFADSFNTQLEEVEQSNEFADVRRQPKKYLQYGNQFLDKVYDRGVIRLDEAHQGKGKDFVIKVLRGNAFQQQTLENLLNVESARNLLSDSLPYSRLSEPEFLYPVLEDLIQPNLTYNDTLTQMFREDLIAGVSNFSGMVRKGEVIVYKNDIVTDSVYQKLISFEEQYQKEVSTTKSDWGIFVGYLLLTSLIVGIFLLYIMIFAPKIFSRFNKLVFILLWLVIFSYLVYAVETTEILSAYMIPFCIVPIVIKTFYGDRLALFTHIVVVLIASYLSSLGYEFTFLQIMAGIVVILSNVDTSNWSRFFYSLLFIFLAYGIGFLGLSLIQEGKLSEVDWSVYSWFLLSVVLTLLAYPLIPLVERFFGFISSISLVELSDMNRPLLQMLALKAPGTLQHSLQVANLAEAAARKIGADPLLVKVAALYHDIGKTKQPAFFIENQSGKNPHNDLDCLESAQIIIGHVNEGVALAKKYRLPTVLIDFIKTHHGTTRVEYFYRNYVKNNPDKEFDDTLFNYPGPRPRTREESILMLADSIEAACKSLKNPTEKDLEDFVDKIVNGKVAKGQLDDSLLKFKELEECREVFKQVMKSVHHVRIEYPEEETPEEQTKEVS